jgi:tetratricopeptide (TPR) repeat protein
MEQYALARQQKAEYSDSLSELRHAISILQAALQRNPGNELLTRELADEHSRSGAVLRRMGRLTESEAELNEAIGLLEPIVLADLRNSQYRGDLAYAWFRLAETLRMKGELARALELHQKALGVRRERAALDTGMPFIRWDLTQSLNAVADSFLTISPRRASEAAALFEEAHRVAEDTLRVAPSFNELRKQVAISDEGLARVALLDAGPKANARRLLEQSLHTWQDVQSRAFLDRQDADQPLQVQALLSSLPPTQ